MSKLIIAANAFGPNAGEAPMALTLETVRHPTDLTVEVFTRVTQEQWTFICLLADALGHPIGGMEVGDCEIMDDDTMVITYEF